MEHCQRSTCSGSMLLEEGELKCTLCGHPKHRFNGGKERHEYLETNRAEITADAGRLGINATLEKWGIAPSTWGKLRLDWHLPDFRQHNRGLPKQILFFPHHEVCPHCGLRLEVKIDVAKAKAPA